MKTGIMTIGIAIVLMMATVQTVAAGPFTATGHVDFENGTGVPYGWKVEIWNLDQEYWAEPWQDITEWSPPDMDYGMSCEYETEDDLIRVLVTSPDEKYVGENISRWGDVREGTLWATIMDVIVYEVPPESYTISGYIDPAADAIKITNLNKPDVVDERPADYIGTDGFYNLTLDVTDEVEAGNVLQITACEALDEYESNCNVTNHTVVNAPGEDVNVNLTLNHYCLDLTGFPMYEAEEVGDPAAYNKGCGPAVAKMWLDYMHNSTTQWDDTHFGDMPAMNQAQLYDWGIGNNSNTSLPYLDTQGMWYTVQYLDPEPYSEYGYNFGKYSSTDQDYMVKQICKWLSYAPGKKPGHPVHVPGAVPAFGNYENWMAVRGIHTSEDAYPLPADLLVYGLWVNDPYPASLGGIGENSYKTIAEWNTTYYLPLDVPGDDYDGKYVGILEPPGDNDGEITIVPSEARFTESITPALEENSIRIFYTRKTIRERRLMLEEINKIVQAAKDGANEQLVPYDDNFAEIFTGNKPGMPKFVSSDNGDYYLVPFGEQPIVAMNTLAVVRVDAEDGRFLEASWVSEPEQYLPVSFVKAVRLSLNEMGIYRFRDMIRTIRSEQLTIELVYTGGSPYYPDWKITIGDNVFHVSQDETVETIA